MLSNKVKQAKHCAICGETTHNRRTCPNKLIKDTSPIRLEESSDIFCEETLQLSNKRDKLIDDIHALQQYEINPTIGELWIKQKRIIDIKELKHIIDRGIHIDYIALYMDIVEDIEDLY